MKKVYLDTSHIALLSKEWENHSVEGAAFVNQWRSSNYLLAISKAHFAEIAEHQSALTRKARYTFLEQMLPILVENELPGPKEILSCLVLKGLAEKESTDSFFSQRIESPGQLRAFSEIMEIPILNNLFRMIGKAQSYSWKAKEGSIQAKGVKKHRLSDVTQEPLPADLLQGLVSKMKTPDGDLIGEIPPDFRGPIAEEFAKIGALVEKFGEAANQIGTRKALGEFLGLNPLERKTLNSPIENLLDNFNFNSLIEQVALLTGIEADLIKLNVKLHDCPGLCLSVHIRENLIKARDLSANNEYDLEHIQYLPYVDMLFADKRISEITRQVLRKQDLTGKLGITKFPISVSNSISSLQSALFK